MRRTVRGHVNVGAVPLLIAGALLAACTPEAHSASADVTAAAEARNPSQTTAAAAIVSQPLPDAEAVKIFLREVDKAGIERVTKLRWNDGIISFYALPRCIEGISQEGVQMRIVDRHLAGDVDAFKAIPTGEVCNLDSPTVEDLRVLLEQLPKAREIAFRESAKHGEMLESGVEIGVANALFRSVSRLGHFDGSLCQLTETNRQVSLRDLTYSESSSPSYRRPGGNVSATVDGSCQLSPTGPEWYRP